MAKILVVDDSSLSRRTLRRVLEGLGHEVLEATEGLSGLESYFVHRPQLVILDLIMEGMTGIDMLVQLKQMDPSARVVVVTADIQDSTREMVERIGAVGFVNKPVDGESLQEALRFALQGQEEGVR